MRRIYGTTLTPTIAADKQNEGDFAANDLLFDWQAIKVPKNASLNHISYLAPSADNSGQNFGINFIFAKNNSVSLGTVHASIDGAFGGSNDQLLGVFQVAENDRIAGISNGASRLYMNTFVNPSNEFVFADYDNDFDVHTNPGFVTLYVGGTVVGTPNLSTGVLVNEGSGVSADGATTITVDGQDARKTIRPGHILHAQDGAVLGTVSSTAQLSVTLTANNVDELANNDELYIVNPIKFNFGFTTY